MLIHGFTGSPFEMSELAGALAREGVVIATPLLPGHGTRPADLDGVCWQDWVGAVEVAVDAMAARVEQVFVVGQSLGGLLALELASRRRDLAGVASLAAPLWLGGLSATAARLTAAGGPLAFVTLLPKLGGSDVRDPRIKAANPAYRGVSTRALRELVMFMSVVDAALPAITCPVLVLHARHDHTAPVACAHRIAERAHAERIRILLHSFHLIAIDVERDIVAAEVLALLRRPT